MPKDKEEEKFIRKIQNSHSYGIISIPKKLFVELGLKLGDEVVIEKRGSNPLQWEIVIKPNPKRRLSHDEKERGASSR